MGYMLRTLRFSTKRPKSQGWMILPTARILHELPDKKMILEKDGQCLASPVAQGGALLLVPRWAPPLGSCPVSPQSSTHRAPLLTQPPPRGPWSCQEAPSLSEACVGIGKWLAAPLKPPAPHLPAS